MADANKIRLMEKHLETLKMRELEIKQEMDKMWLMQTPERVENLPQPPYVIIKEEFDKDENENPCSLATSSSTKTKRTHLKMPDNVK